MCLSVLILLDQLSEKCLGATLSFLGPGNSCSYGFKCQHYFFIFFHGPWIHEHR